MQMAYQLVFSGQVCPGCLFMGARASSNDNLLLTKVEMLVSTCILAITSWFFSCYVIVISE